MIRSRRGFLRGVSTVLLAAGALPFFRGWSKHLFDHHRLMNSAGDLGEILQLQSAAIVGEVCLQCTMEPDVDAAIPSAASLLRDIHNDFDCGNVVRVDGWVLSRTEARLYALAARQQKHAGGYLHG